MIGKMVDRIGAKYVVIVSLVISLIGSVPLIFITDETSMIWISILLFIRGMSFGGIMLPLMSDAYTGLDSKQLPQAGVGINMIENLGSSFGSAVIATVVATVVQGLQPTIANGLKDYHAGFLVSAVVLGERRPVGHMTVAQAGRIADTGKASPIKNKGVKAASVHDHLHERVGYHYASQAVIESDTNHPPLDHFELNGRPGTRAPHVWGELQDKHLFTLDLFGFRFVLLTSPEARGRH